MNPENKCSHLLDQDIPKLQNPLVDIFNMQASLQKHLAAKGRALDYDNASFKDRVSDISIQWRNFNLEMSELLERLPYKEWKSYTPEQLNGFESVEARLETLMEWVDCLHFFVNIGLALGIDGELAEKLYVAKNKENFDRQEGKYK
jgi:dimeric dUTPase (all-alpha-NTP-PPase superfamily)